MCQCGIQKMDNPDPKVNRLYPVQNGVITSVMKNYEAAVSGENLPGRGAQMYRKIFVDGIGACRELFDGMERGEFENCFIEANMCEGGCINGPAVNRLHVSRFKAKMNMEQQIEYEDPGYAPFPPQLHIEKMFYSRANKDHMPTEEQIQVILKATANIIKIRNSTAEPAVIPHAGTRRSPCFRVRRSRRCVSPTPMRKRILWPM